MVFIEYFLRTLQIEIVVGEFIPGQFEEKLEVIALDSKIGLADSYAAS
jgi:hypothetical protein